MPARRVSKLKEKHGAGAWKDPGLNMTQPGTSRGGASPGVGCPGGFSRQHLGQQQTSKKIAVCFLLGDFPSHEKVLWGGVGKHAVGTVPLLTDFLHSIGCGPQEQFVIGRPYNLSDTSQRL